MGDENYGAFARHRHEVYGGTRQAALVRAAAPEREQQNAQLARVSDRITGAILAFFVTKAPGTEFHADDLRKHVAGQCGQVAPDSARRIASQMKRDGSINFECVNRAQSLFRVLPVKPKESTS